MGSELRVWFLWLVKLSFVIGSTVVSYDSDKPNIVVILADDLGWNDVSFHGSDQIQTPNIDTLAYYGVALNRYYTHPECTPSRSAFLTGKYAHTLGMQGWPLTLGEDRGIPTNVTLLPSYLKDAGYSTHLVGKWHVGGSRLEFLPTSRGFDSSFGHRFGFVDYYEYTNDDQITVDNVTTNRYGLDLFRNTEAAWDVEGYITDVYTEQALSVISDHDTTSPLFLLVNHNAPHAGTDASPLQAPPEVVREMRYIESSERKVFAAMVKKLDNSVGEIVQALQEKGILENTIIVFASDNGGMTSGLLQNYASNYPLRGLKLSPFEGGTRVVGLVWSANLNNPNHYYDGYMHSIDWLPTLLSAAGLEVPSDIDGVSQWDSINSNAESERTTIYEIDDFTGYYTVTYKDFKLLTGEVVEDYSTYQGGDLRGVISDPPCYEESIYNSAVYKVFSWFGLGFNDIDLNLRNTTTVQCGPPPTDSCFPDDDKVCLYNIRDDPCETIELSASYPDLVATMKDMLAVEMTRMIPRTNVVKDPLSDPKRFNNTWDTWIDNESWNYLL